VITTISIAIVVLALVNLFTMLAVARSPHYSVGQKVTQSLLIWLVPLFGALAAWLVIRQMSYEPERQPDHSPPLASGNGYSQGASFGGDGGADGGGDGG
jgi:uncharacterized membrane protein YgcG